MIRNNFIISFIFFCFSLVIVVGFQSHPTHLTFSANKVTTSCLKAVSSSLAGRQKQVSRLRSWGKEAGIQVGSTVDIEESKISGGLGLITNGSGRNTEAGSVVVTVPASLALSVEIPNGGPDDISVMKDLVEDRSVFRSLPWYIQFSLYLLKLDKISPYKNQAEDVSLQPWLDSLPRKFTTPIHWETKERQEWLQYAHMVESVERQETYWKTMYNKLQSCCSSRIKNITWEDFLWGCECARSRAFSGGYTGTSFNPFVYAFTFFLVTVYTTLNLGTLEQAANGAAIVFCASVLRDFVVPKFFKTKKYVICPVIDMANHNSLKATANVAFEYFTNAYSLSTTSVVTSNTELFISYGSRSNDQLLQYYGFVEHDNPQDTYVMPPLRDWDIAALEEACGGISFPPGRLQKLDRAGLLGTSESESNDAIAGSMVTGEEIAEEGVTSAGNPRGGVVLSRAVGLDPAVFQALRALVSNDGEWEQAGFSIGNFAAEMNPENERKARIAARTAIEMELASKPTTIEMDRVKLSSKAESLEPEERMAIMFRIEKKKLLKETIEKLL